MVDSERASAEQVVNEPMLSARVQARLTQLAPGATRLLVAVSGGADSVTLLRLLDGGPWALTVAHFDHGLRPDSSEDAAFVAALAAGLGLPFATERADVGRVASQRGWNPEDAARRLRYAFLARAAKRAGADAVVTAHTLDDQAETVLLQLLRGAAFLTGMRARRGRVVRPLLGVAKTELLEHLNALGQPWRDDATNRDTQRTRAWLRAEVLPLLAMRYPGLGRVLARHAELQQEVAEHLEGLTRPFLASGSVDAVALAREGAALQRQVVAGLLAGAGVGFDAAAVERLRGHLSDVSPYRLTLSPDTTARIAYGRLELVRSFAAPLPEVSVSALGDLPADLKPSVLELDGLVYRSRKPGDHIHLSGGTKKLSDFLIDLKIPREQRDAIRLLASGARVVWVEGLAVDPEYALAQADPALGFMRVALEQARLAAEAGELPVGAVVVRGGEVVARAHNRTEADRDPSAHAEILALRAAARVLGDWRLADCTLYVTLEPCPMCFGAVLQAHLPQLVYGARNRREGALGGVADLSTLAWKRRLSVRGGVLAGASAKLLRDFFAQRR